MTHQIKADTCLGYPLSRTPALGSHLTILPTVSEISQVLRSRRGKATPIKGGQLNANECEK